MISSYTHVWEMLWLRAARNKTHVDAQVNFLTAIRCASESHAHVCTHSHQPATGMMTQQHLQDCAVTAFVVCLPAPIAAAKTQRAMCHELLFMSCQWRYRYPPASPTRSHVHPVTACYLCPEDTMMVANNWHVASTTAPSARGNSMPGPYSSTM